MRQDRLDRWVGAVLLILAVGWTWIVVTTIPASSEVPGAGPQGFPLMMGVLLGALGVALAAASVLQAGAADDRARRVERVSAREARTAAGTTALLLAYGFVMQQVGFAAATLLFVALILRLILDVRSWPKIAALAIGITAGCYLVFITVLEVPLPRGLWIELY